MFRILGVFAILAALMTAAFASAATLGVNGGVAQAGGDDNLVCTTANVEVFSWGLNDHITPMTSSKVTLTNVPAACDGARMGFTLYGEDGTTKLAVSKADSHTTGASWASINGDATTKYLFDLVPDHGGVVLDAANGVPIEDIYEIRVWIEGSGE